MDGLIQPSQNVQPPTNPGRFNLQIQVNPYSNLTDAELDAELKRLVDAKTSIEARADEVKLVG